MNLSHLKDKNFWMKGASILMWSFHLSVYVWLFSYLQGSQSHLHKFTGVAASVLVGGIGFTSITNLYNTKRTEFNPKYFYSALSIFVLFGCGAWALWIYKIANGPQFESVTSFTAGLCFFYLICIFVTPTYMLSQK